MGDRIEGVVYDSEGKPKRYSTGSGTIRVGSKADTPDARKKAGVDNLKSPTGESSSSRPENVIYDSEGNPKAYISNGDQINIGSKADTKEAQRKANIKITTVKQEKDKPVKTESPKQTQKSTNVFEQEKQRQEALSYLQKIESRSVASKVGAESFEQHRRQLEQKRIQERLFAEEHPVLYRLKQTFNPTAVKDVVSLQELPSKTKVGKKIIGKLEKIEESGKLFDISNTKSNNNKNKYSIENTRYGVLNNIDKQTGNLGNNKLKHDKGNDLTIKKSFGAKVKEEIVKDVGSAGKEIVKKPATTAVSLYLGARLFGALGTVASKVPVLSKLKWFTPAVQITAVGGVVATSVAKQPTSEEKVATAIEQTAIVGGFIGGSKLLRNVKTKSSESYATKVKEQLSRDVIVKDVPKAPAIIRKDVSVEVYGRPIETVQGIQAKATAPTLSTQKGSIEVGLGKPQPIPKDNLGFNYVVLEGLQRKDLFIGSRANIKSTSTLPMTPKELTTPTGTISSITQPYQGVIQKGYFESLLSTKSTSVKSTKDSVSITKVIPQETKVNLAKTEISSKGTEIPTVMSNQFVARVGGVNIKGKEFTTDITPYKSKGTGAKQTVEITPDEVTGDLKPQLAGKEVREYFGAGGLRAKQLYVYDRADIKMQQFGTSENPVAETYTVPTTAFVGQVFGQKVQVTKKSKDDSITNTVNIGQDTHVINPDGTINILKTKPKIDPKTETKTEQKTSELEKGKQKPAGEQAKSQTFTGQTNDVFIKPTVIVETLKPKVAGKSKSKSKGGSMSKPKFVPFTDTQQPQTTKPVSGVDLFQPQKPAQKQPQALDQIQSITPAYDVSSAYKTSQIGNIGRAQVLKQIKDDLVTTAKNPFLLDKQKNKQKELGFDVYVREKGVFRKASGVPLTQEQALNFGALKVQQSASASFKLMPSSTEASERRYAPIDLSRFFMSKKESGVYVQKREERIKSAGELVDITFKGIEARRKSKNIFKI